MRTYPTASLCRKRPALTVHQMAAELMFSELRSSRVNYPNRFHSMAEAISVLEEEIDELRDAIRANIVEHARAEAVQVGAMALRLNIDLREGEPSAGVDRLAVQSVVARAQHSEPAEPLVSAHEGKGFIRGCHEQMCLAIAQGDLEKVTRAAADIAVLALRFVAEVPAVSAIQVSGSRG